MKHLTLSTVLNHTILLVDRKKGIDVRGLLMVTDEYSKDAETRGDRMKKVLSFIEKYVPKLYGKRAVKKWLKNNKGKSLLDMITMSDVAYCAALVENNHEVWDEELEIEKMPTEEQDKFKKENQDDMSPEEMKKYTKKKKPKFTSGTNGKRTYLSHGWNKEGIEMFNDTWASMREMSNDQETWESLMILWDEREIDENSIENWRVRRCDDNITDDENEYEEESPQKLFFFPGHDNFQYDSSWKQGQGGTRKDRGKEDEENVGGGQKAGQTEAGDQMNEEQDTTPAKHKNTNSKSICEDSDGEDVMPKYKGTKCAKRRAIAEDSDSDDSSEFDSFEKYARDTIGELVQKKKLARISDQYM